MPVLALSMLVPWRIITPVKLSLVINHATVLV